MEVAFQLRCTGRNFSPGEKNPFVKVFLDARFDRTPKVFPLDDSKKAFRGSVSGVLRENHVINGSTALCFAGIAWRSNETGSPCMLDVGVAHVTFNEIDLEIKTHGRFVRQMPLKMYTADGLEKAHIELRIDSLNWKNDFPEVISAQVAPLISNYISSTLRLEQEMEETFGPQTSNMRIPYDYSESGIQSGDGTTPLPAVAYVMSETPKSNDHYWSNAFEVVMDRDGLKPSDWKRLNLDGKARASVNVMCYIAQYLDYIGDTVDTNVSDAKYNPRLVKPYENFGDGIGLVGGDCEDLGSANLQCTNSLIEHTFDRSAKHYDVMLEMQSIARQYVPPLSLDVVRGAQVSDKVESYGAHMNDNYIPAYMFKQWMEKTPEGRRLSKRLSWEIVESSRPPFLVGEGTGMYETLGFKNPLRSLMGYVYNSESLEGFKKRITRDRGDEGNFFVGSLVGLTDYFHKRGASEPMSFWYCNVEKGMSRGASYHDMMNRPENVAVKVHPPVSKQIMAEMSEKTLRRLPPLPLTLTPGLEKNAKRRHNSHLDHISKSIAKLNRPQGSLHHKVPVFVRPHQINSALANRIVQDFVRRDRIWKVEYKLEEITDTIYGYRMDVYVK
jgi:hypothetical protein